MAAPLPAGVYSGTMGYADVYPAHRGIGGIGTQDRAIPAFVESQLADQAGSIALGSPLERALVGTPAGWYLLALVALLVAVWVLE